MLGKVGKSRVGAKDPGKSPFADLVNYVAREADGKGREVDKGEMGVVNLDAIYNVLCLVMAAALPEDPTGRTRGADQAATLICRKTSAPPFFEASSISMPTRRPSLS